MRSGARASGVSQALLDWARGYDGLPTTLHLNASVERPGDCSLLTGSASVETSYIDGTADRRMDFVLSLMAEWSEGADALNADAMARGEAWLDWVSAQAAAGSLPELPEGVTALEIGTDDQVPALSMVFEATGTARYQFAAHLIYHS